MKQYGGGPDESHIEANRNGVVSFAEFLLESIDETNAENGYTIPGEFFGAGSDIVLDGIYLVENKVAENKVNNNQFEPASVLTQLGCAAACLAIVVVFIVGCISSITWLADLF